MRALPVASAWSRHELQTLLEPFLNAATAPLPLSAPALRRLFAFVACAYQALSPAAHASSSASSAASASAAGWHAACLHVHSNRDLLQPAGSRALVAAYLAAQARAAGHRDEGNHEPLNYLQENMCRYQAVSVRLEYLA
jgi:hypothetical protein